MEILTHLSLFSGIGGMDLAAEMAGFQTVGQCEFADFPNSILEKHWPNVPRWRDVRELTGESFRSKTNGCTPTIVSGGFPCQPHSIAGKRLASDDERDLWSELLRVFCETNGNGLWEKMYQGCSQVKMEGFSGEYSGTWPKSGVLHGGIVSQPILAELSTSGNGFALWPRPIASDGEAWLKCSKSNPMQSIRKCWKHGKQDRTNYYHIQNGLNPNQAADLNGMMMGFPEGWTG